MNNGNTWRRFKDSSGSWGTWYRVDNYGTTSLSELASALGVRTVIDSGSFNHLYMLNNTFAYGQIEGAYSHQSAESVAEDFRTKMVNLGLTGSFSFSIRYNKSGDELLTGYMVSNYYVFIEAFSIWGYKWRATKTGPDATWSIETL